MSHQKIDELKGIKTEVETSAEKTKHLEQIGRMIDFLKQERMKENQQTEMILMGEESLKSIREAISMCNADPNIRPYKILPGNWGLQYPTQQAALDKLYDDQRRIENEVVVLKTQRKMARENQLESINALNKKTAEIVKMNCFKATM